MIKKILPLILCFIMVSSCSINSNTLLSFIDNNDTTANYYGAVVTAYNAEGSVFAYADDNSLQSDALWKRIHDIEKKLNVQIEMKDNGGSGWSFIEYHKTRTAAGSLETDLIYRSGGNHLWYIGEAGCLLPITDFPDYIDLSDTNKYGTPGVLEAAMFNGVPYAVQPTYWPGLQGIECFFVTYNTEEYEANGLTDLHEYYENETWTWDTFKKHLDMSAQVVEPGEIIFEAHGGYLLNTLFMSNGFDYVTFIDGIPQFDLSPKEALDSIEYLKELSLYGDKIQLNADRWSCAAFIDGKALTTIATAQAVTTGNIAYNSNFVYRIMPFPCGPNVKYGTWQQSVTRIYGLAIPVGADDPDCSAHIINELCEPFEEFGGSREGLIQYYKDNIFSSELDVEIFFEVEKNVRYDYDDATLINDYTAIIAEQIDKASASELLQKNSNLIKEIFNKYIEPNLNGYLIEHMNIE